MGHDCSIWSALLPHIWEFGAEKQRISPGRGIFRLPSWRRNRPIDTASTGPSEPAKASDAGATPTDWLEKLAWYWTTRWRSQWLEGKAHPITQR